MLNQFSGASGGTLARAPLAPRKISVLANVHNSQFEPCHFRGCLRLLSPIRGWLLHGSACYQKKTAHCSTLPRISTWKIQERRRSPGYLTGARSGQWNRRESNSFTSPSPESRAKGQTRIRKGRETLPTAKFQS